MNFNNSLHYRAGQCEICQSWYGVVENITVQIHTTVWIVLSELSVGKGDRRLVKHAKMTLMQLKGYLHIGKVSSHIGESRK